MRVQFGALQPNQYQARVLSTVGGFFRLWVQATAPVNVIVMRQDQFLLYRDWQPGRPTPMYEVYRRGAILNEFVMLAAGTYVLVVEGVGVPSFGSIDFTENYPGPSGPSGAMRY